ncbi:MULTISPECIES: D-alanyl-D-alanine carboxypeptidase family protein [Streptomyces]|uniref:D-alanyl-D-alanine carboxypeptidase n=1 Tax=Streptomyces spororaveus TaxID=284039 RepID=A0ABQ3TCQ7_9ACTN|nr:MULTISPECIES: D-alanyl-D-alanine carboxypeptidase [Streptomyces]MCM9081376.1 D-alanyl-D-alanine carboxypeptidase [Streptomyces spororaveus]MCX5304177.1 D-alanyl-D-alanine carboxypeptidase [Streptomyces sp. NBC_00160]GHI78200.1 D-alanyl-D-alanine carboxypeptidase [Streptomyces spororaveus]
MSAKTTALTVLSAALLVPTLLVAPAHAAPTPPADAKGLPGKAPAPAPPVSMSTVGGSLLGQPGTQVNLLPGAPALPANLTGRSWIVADADSGEVLAAHNAHWQLPPASTMKMLFADTVLPSLPKEQIHQVTDKDMEGVGPGSSMVGVKEHLEYSVHDLWLGVFLKSGNDAVHVLSAMNGGIDKTVKDMQAHAEELQALDTHVVSPDGYDAPGQVSSAYDLTLFARSGLQKQDFREYCSTVSAKFPGLQEPGKPREYFEIANTNRLLTGAAGITPYKGMAGVKNGNTSLAGATFTGVAQQGPRKLLVTVMNPDGGGANLVYEQTAALLDWGFAAAGKVKPVGELVPPKSADASSHGSPAQSHENNPSAAGKDAGGGAGTALGVAGGALALLAGGAFVINRRWPRGRRGRGEELI